MFNKEKNPTSYEKQPSGSATLISAGTTLKGDLLSDTDLRIDGTIKGNVSCSAKIIIGSTGFVDGNIEGSQADVMGKVHGNIAVKELLQLRGECSVLGNISAAKLQIEPTATFNGQCQMASAPSTSNLPKNAAATAKASIVQMSADVQPATAEAK
ncbi:MAG TPA: polymer-forming cytoskeletal protein [Chitinophagaceae bacterium]|jgi:cytoskeletal protein CcmA (bactofilin family)|nr:polymer-forming cytoskeletal protein [Chitinophagaceae bacterium]